MSWTGAVGFMLNFKYLNLSMTDNITAAAAAALNSGVDINSGGFMHNTDSMMDNCSQCAHNMSGYAYQHLPQALAEGMINEATLRLAATRTLRLRFELGLFDPHGQGPFDRINSASIDSASHRALARRSAVEGLVLLRNAGDLLPLTASRLDHVAVIGPNADRQETLLSNYNGCRGKSGNFINRNDASPRCRLVTPLEGLRSQLPATTTVTHHIGAQFNSTSTDEIPAAVAAAAAADVAIVVVGLVPTGQGNGDPLGGAMVPKSKNGTDPTAAAGEGEAHDRVLLGLSGAQRELVQAVLAAQKRTVLVLMSGGLISEPELVRGSAAVPAIVQSFYGGEEAGAAIAAVLLGQESFSGRLPVTMVEAVDQLPPYFLQQLSAPPGRTHRYLRTEPLFPFGFGVSSRAVTYKGLQATPGTFAAATPPANVSVTVSVAASPASVAAVVPEVVQVYFSFDVKTKPAKEEEAVGAQNEAPDPREAGAASIPLHELKAFRRVALPPDGSAVELHFNVEPSSLALMKPDGAMGLLAGSWTVFVGGTSPRTPVRLLRGGVDASEGSPAAPLQAKLHVTDN